MGDDTFLVWSVNGYIALTKMEYFVSILINQFKFS